MTSDFSDNRDADRSDTAAEEIARLKDRVAALEDALADYAHRYGLTDKAREAMRRSDNDRA